MYLKVKIEEKNIDVNDLEGLRPILESINRTVSGELLRSHARLKTQNLAIFNSYIYVSVGFLSKENISLQTDELDKLDRMS